MKNLKFQLITAKLQAVELILKRTVLYDPYISNQEFQFLIDIKDRDAQTLRRLKYLPFKKIDGTILYKLSDVRDYVNRVYGPKTTK